MPSIYDWILKANGVDLATIGVFVVAMDGNWDSPGESFDEVSIPLRNGTRRTGTRPKVDSLDYTLTLFIGAATESAFETACDSLKYLLSQELTIIGGNQPDRQRTGRKKGQVKIRPNLAGGDGVVDGIATVTIHCEDPVQYATTVTTESASSGTDHPCPLGTRFVFPTTTITFTGSASSVTLTYKNYAGTTIGTPMVLTHAFVNADVLVVDHNLMTAALNGSRDDRLITAGDFIALDPRDGDPSLSHWPTVRTSAGNIAIAYRKAFE